MDIFESASRLKLRFPSPKGLLTTEDLWDLPLTSSTGKANLDTIACTLHAEIESQPKVSFVINKAASAADKTAKLALDVVVRVIEVRLAENEQKQQLDARREKKQQLMALIAQKENEQLAGSSLDDLRAMIAQLGE